MEVLLYYNGATDIHNTIILHIKNCLDEYSNRTHLYILKSQFQVHDLLFL